MSLLRFLLCRVWTPKGSKTDNNLRGIHLPSQDVKGPPYRSDQVVTVTHRSQRKVQKGGGKVERILYVNNSRTTHMCLFTRRRRECGVWRTLPFFCQDWTPTHVGPSLSRGMTGRPFRHTTRVGVPTQPYSRHKSFTHEQTPSRDSYSCPGSLPFRHPSCTTPRFILRSPAGMTKTGWT